jgi:hypothetical protein
MEIQLPHTTDIVVVTERKVSVDKLTINELVDLPSKKMVVAKTAQVGQVVLWKDADYDAIGQWTDTDVANRLLELYGN